MEQKGLKGGGGTGVQVLGYPWPLQLNNLRKPFPQGVASSGMKDTHTYRAFWVPPKSVIKSHSSSWGRFWTKSLSATIWQLVVSIFLC